MHHNVRRVLVIAAKGNACSDLRDKVTAYERKQSGNRSEFGYTAFMQDKLAICAVNLGNGHRTVRNAVEQLCNDISEDFVVMELYPFATEGYMADLHINSAEQGYHAALDCSYATVSMAFWNVFAEMFPDVSAETYQKWLQSNVPTFSVPTELSISA